MRWRRSVKSASCFLALARAPVYAESYCTDCLGCTLSSACTTAPNSTPSLHRLRVGGRAPRHQGPAPSARCRPGLEAAAVAVQGGPRTSPGRGTQGSMTQLRAPYRSLARFRCTRPQSGGRTVRHKRTLFLTSLPRGPTIASCLVERKQKSSHPGSAPPTRGGPRPSTAWPQRFALFSGVRLPGLASPDR